MVRPASAHRPAPYVAVVDRIEGIDIDYPEDFALAEVIAKLPNR